jgi:hypothetical protein
MGKLAYLLLSVLSLVLIPGVAPAVTPQPPPQLPEPTSLFLIMAGFLGIFGFRWIFKK